MFPVPPDGLDLPEEYSRKESPYLLDVLRPVLLRIYQTIAHDILCRHISGPHPCTGHNLSEAPVPVRQVHNYSLCHPFPSNTLHCISLRM